jgi:glycosyltransferase involved in cell wall biosynthesis
MKESDIKPLVTVIIPTYNRRELIGECLDSVLGQTYSNIEIIVVDDCSTDGTVEWLRSEGKYKSVIIHQLEKNGGAATARNAAIAMAKGELIAFSDSDDLLLPDHVEKAVKTFEKYPDLGLFCCDSTMIDGEGNIILNGKTWHENLGEAKNIKIETGFRSQADVFERSDCFPGFTLRPEVFKELGGFDQSMFPAEDYDLALRVAGSRFKVFYLHEALCLRREHGAQASGIFNSVKTQVKLLEALEHTIERNPEAFLDRSRVSNRLAEVKMDLALSKIKEGKRSAGLRSMVDSLATDPREIMTLARIGGRKLRRVFGAG